MVMSTVKITQRLHLWAGFDGAFYRPHSTQARTLRLKCVHYGNVDGEYFYLTKHFSCRLFIMHFSSTSVYHKNSIKHPGENHNQKMARLRVWEYFLLLESFMTIFHRL